MSEFRQNITNGEWVIISTERAARPHSFKAKKGPIDHSKEYDSSCPFCPGSQVEDVKTLFEIRGETQWNLKVIPNKYAALDLEQDPRRLQEGIHLKAGGYGSAEVVIESPIHNLTLADMTVSQVAAIIQAYKTRYNALCEDRYINTINIFRNSGPRAGASLVHPHSQIIASMVTPPHISDQVFYARNHFNTWGKCVYCTMIEAEKIAQERIIEETDHFIALCPYASKSPYETRIYPKRHYSVFGDIAPPEEKELAKILRNVLKKIYLLLDNPDYNYIIRSITTNDGEVQFYHWYIVVIPKLRKIAGFEIGTGIYINVTKPEECARQLREQSLK